jgi:transposase
VLDGIYSQIGSPSIPPERLLKAQLLIALYSVRSDRLFCETLDYDILFRWFLDMGLEEPSFDASTFSKNRERLAGEEVALRFFDAVVRKARALELLSGAHFSVDGTLIEARASMKSFRPKDGGGSGPDAGGDRDFKGWRRRNDTHASTTDPEAKLLRKALGKEAKLCFAGHALMDNRHGLISDVCVTPSVGVTEPEAAPALVARQRRKHLRLKSVGGDQGYHTSRFVEALLAQRIAAHVAINAAHYTTGPDRSTLDSPGYRASQIVRKRIEQFFGWGQDGGRPAQDPTAGRQAQQAADVPDWLGLQPGTHQSNVSDHRIGVGKICSETIRTCKSLKHPGFEPPPTREHHFDGEPMVLQPCV